MRIRRYQLNPQGLRAGDVKEDESLMLSATFSTTITAGLDPKLSHGPLRTNSECTHLCAAGDVSMIMAASNYSASVNWLDRLRAVKGFPRIDPILDISKFLSSAAELSCTHDEIAAPLELVSDRDAASCFKQESLNFSHILQVQGCNGSGEKHVISAGLSSFPSPRACDVGNAGVRAESESSSLSHISDHSNISVIDTLSRNRSSSCSKEGNDAGQYFLPTSHQNEAGEFLKKSSLSCHSSKEDTGLSQLYFNMFADLFCMEVRSLSTSTPMEAGKKQQRKQEKPKPCSNFADTEPRYAVVTSPQLQTHQFDSELTHKTNSSNRISQSQEAPEEKLSPPNLPPKVEEKGKASLQQKETSNTNSKKKDTIDVEERSVKNEILVIDTSLTGWKVEKVIVRKGKGWKIKSKGVSAAKDHGTGECSARIADDEQARAPQVCSIRREITIKVQRDQELIGACKEKSKGGSRTMERLNAIQQHVIKVWNTTPHTHARSSRKRKRSEPVGDEHLQGNIKLGRATHEPKPSEQATNFAVDHPANQPKEGLVHSIYQVFTQAGRAGLTAREAVSRILEQGLPGVHEGGVAPRVEVLKIVSNSPYFMPLEESKYILCSSLVGDEEPRQDYGQDGAEHGGDDNRNNCSDSVKPAKEHGVSQYWVAIRRARTGKTRRKPSPESAFRNTWECHDPQQRVIAEQASKKRLKSVKQDATGLGNRCNRSDGKGWHCPLRAKVGYLLCDHHLDRLRTRVNKSYIKSRLSMTKALKEERVGLGRPKKAAAERRCKYKHRKDAVDDEVEAQQNSITYA